MTPTGPEAADTAHPRATGAEALPGPPRTPDREGQDPRIAGRPPGPGEIEAVLDRHPGIAHSAVIAVGEEHVRHLVVFYTPTRPGPGPGSVLRYLRQAPFSAPLPDVCYALAELPLDERGRPDRTLLERWALLWHQGGPAGQHPEDHGEPGGGLAGGPPHRPPWEPWA